MMTTLSLQIVGIIEPLIQHADWFFPGGRVCPMVVGTAGLPGTSWEGAQSSQVCFCQPPLLAGAQAGLWPGSAQH